VTVPTGTNGECHWVCLVGTRWVWDSAYPNYPPPCGEDEQCCPPTYAGASGDKTTTGCVPLGSC